MGNRQYSINIWNKSLGVTRVIDENHNMDAISINDIWAKSCPKCDTLFNPTPTHGTKLKCLCGAEFKFHGTCNPSPINETLQEIKAIIEVHDNCLRQHTAVPTVEGDCINC